MVGRRSAHRLGAIDFKYVSNVDARRERPSLGDSNRREGVPEDGSRSTSNQYTAGGWTRFSASRSSWYMQQDRHDNLTSSMKEMNLTSDSVGRRYGNSIEEYKEDCISSLPDDLLEGIFVVLPLWSLFRATVVCKRWRQIITSKRFMAACAQSPPQKPWYCMYKDSDYSVGISYDPSSCKWHRFTLPSFDPLASFVSSANGLACFMDKTKCDVLYVCNPMTKKWRKLQKPMLSCLHDYTSVAMAVDRNNHTYKVVVAISTPVPGDYRQWNLSVDVYDSLSDGWSTSAKTLLHGWRAGEESKICNGTMYCVSQSIVATGSVDSRHGLITYDLKLGKFNDTMISMPCSLSCARLVSCRDNLILVGGIGTYDFIKGVGIWGLLDKEWKLIGRMPRNLFYGFSGGLDDVFSCSGHADLIFIHSYGSPQLMIFNVTSRSWNWAKTCPVLRRDPLHLFTGFCFEPNLNATV